ncbi:hypothetical protein BP6252_10172 [Coleophoma cylindrospora]|uniref:Zn(2)-C6 fungal-type domain-containing protein n=1 Tax=Coleophoma cylindrospora TaxID=1849047 RepID=A0A3D8QXN0_9HELO|nr:hypothetical protein BP6252_10172 [Coleophoma cylindrospora]
MHPPSPLFLSSPSSLPCAFAFPSSPLCHAISVRQDSMVFAPDKPDANGGLSSQACARCRGRKKKCDRQLPQCNACVQSNAACSFQDTANPDSEEMGLFRVSYVRDLERQVREFKQHGHAASNEYNALFDNFTGGTPHPSGSPAGAVNGGTPSSRDNYQTPGRDSSGNGPTTSASGRLPETHGALESEVELLSLRATADMYLGAASGVSFARLTQAVLKRLKPDVFHFKNAAAPEQPPQPWSPPQDNTPNAFPAESPWGMNEPAVPPIDPAARPKLPTEEEAMQLAEYYWCHTHTLYPFMRRRKFMESLKRMYATPDDPVLQSCAFQYTMWMVFAISSTTLASVTMNEETESHQFWNNAMLYFEGALARGNMSALNALLLQVAYSFFNQVGPNTWYLVGMAGRLAIGMGLHTPPSNVSTGRLSPDVLEHRKRLFFSLYMMDRMVSIALGRPFSIRDEDVEIEPFADVDDDDLMDTDSLSQKHLALSAMAVPLHILQLRKIAGEIFHEVYTNKNRHLDTMERDRIVAGLHEKLIHWRRTMPFPLPESQVPRVPQLSTTWFDLNYHTHVVLLYRPSPLFPVLNLEKVTLLASGSQSAIRHAFTMYRQQRFAFNWLNLFSLFSSVLALIYSVTAQPDALASYLQRSEALSDLRLAAELLQAFEKKFPQAWKCREILQDVLSRLESYLPAQSRLSSSDPLSPVQQLMPQSELPEQTSVLSPGFDANATAYPLFLTGNASYDALLGLVQGFEYDPALEGFDF